MMAGGRMCHKVVPGGKGDAPREGESENRGRRCRWSRGMAPNTRLVAAAWRWRWRASSVASCVATVPGAVGFWRSAQQQNSRSASYDPAANVRPALVGRRLAAIDN